jgi:hypothetical protein
MNSEFALRFLKVRNNNLLKFLKKFCCNYIFIYILLIGTVMTGLVLHFLKFETAFPRVGAVLICFALTFVYFNHFVSSSLASLHSRTTELDSMKSELKKVSVSHPDHQVLNSVLTHLEAPLKKELDVTELAQSRLVTAEFLLGVLGTIIWGFGDLLPSFT